MFVCLGTYVTQVTATDADDPTYGNSAHIVYSILHGQPYFSVDPKTGERTATHDMLELFHYNFYYNQELLIQLYLTDL